MKRDLQILLLVIFTAMLGLGIISPIMPVYAQSLELTMVQIGFLGSAWSISRFVFTAPAGRLSDTYSKKRIIAFGLGSYAAVSILYSLAWDFTSLISIRFLHGVGSAMAMPVAMAYAAELAPDGMEGRFMGTMNLAMFAGMSLGPFIGGTLSEMFDLNAPFYLMGGLTSLSLLFTILFLPDQASEGDGQVIAKPSFRKVLSNKVILAAFIYRAVNALGRGAIMSFLSLYIATPMDAGGLGLSLTIAGTVLTVGQMTTALLQRPFGELADRYNKNALIVIGGVLGAIGMAMFTLAYDFWSLLAARLVFSAGGALSMPAISAIATIEGRDLGVGTTMSVVQSAMSVGNIVGPILSGTFVELFGLQLIFSVGGGISLMGVFIFVILSRIALRDRHLRPISSTA
ncbi:MAG: MFS transporter [Candidatus Bathyarchaeia archaeon]